MKKMTILFFLMIVPCAAAALESAEAKVEEIKAQIAQQPLGPYELLIYYDTGVVTLRGDVASPPDQQRIRDTVLRVEGVQLINDETTISSRARFGAEGGAGGDDEQLEERVRAVLGQEDPEAKVSVEVRDGRATLNGNLSSRSAVDQVLASVLNVPGVQDIESHIKVDGHDYMTESYKKSLDM